MKQYLLPRDGTFYKANLHAHSTLSDGAATPAEIRDAYRARGYSVVAFTDHDVMVDQSALCGEDFLALNGYELRINDHCQRVGSDAKTYHLCLIARTPKVCEQVFFNPRGRFYGKVAELARAVKYRGEPAYEYPYSPIFVNRVVREAKAAGFLTVYCHPRWSLHTAEDYLSLRGLLGVEVMNGNSLAESGASDEGALVYEQMLRAGANDLLPLASDDNHNADGFDGDNTDSFLGFTMIKAPCLSYTAITDALLRGDCYASCGPTIEELYIEDGRVHVTCSPVREILLRTRGREGARLHRRGDAPLCEGSFALRAEYGYFRLELVDAAGRRAYTRAYAVKGLG